MPRLYKFVHWIELSISMAALSALLVSVTWGVLTRYITEKPAVWTTELSGILFTWVVFVGAASALRGDQHIRVTLLMDLLPARPRRTLAMFGQLITILFLFVVTYLAYQMMVQGATRPSPVMRIPFSLVYLATFLAFAEMSVSSLIRLLLQGHRIAAGPELHDGGS